MAHYDSSERERGDRVSTMRANKRSELATVERMIRVVEAEAEQMVGTRAAFKLIDNILELLRDRKREIERTA